MKKGSIILFVGLVTQGLAGAQVIDPIDRINHGGIGSVGYGGSGCPDGTVAIESDMQSGELFLRFSDFGAYSGSVAKKIARKSCGLAIPISIPQGLQVALVAEIRGQHLTRGNGRTVVGHEIFQAGSQGVRHQEVLDSSSARQFALSALPEWSACGADTNLRANLSLMTQGRAMASIEEVSLKLLFRLCQ